MKPIWLYLLSVLLLIISGAALDAQNQGAPNMVLEGGRQGDVPFPHLKHQTNLKDCNACHTLFAQQRGIIEQLKAQGQLKRKGPVMNQCKQCHTNLARKGQTAGPRTCRNCHSHRMKKDS